MLSRNIKALITPFLVSLAMFSALRLCFFLYSHWYFKELTLTQTLFSFLHGIRFDAYCVAWGCTPTILFWLFGGLRYQALRWLASLAFPLTSLAFLFPILINLEYFEFSNRHMTRDVLGMKGDIGAQWWNLMSHYPILVLLLAACIGLLWYCRPRLTPETQPLPRTWQQWTQCLTPRLVLLALTIITLRGGLQGKPLAPAHAYVEQNEKVGVLTLNSGFTFMRTKVGKPLPSFLKVSLGSSALAATQNTLKQTQAFPFQHERPQNVVILLLESFALEYFNLDNDKPSYAPFVHELAQSSLFFQNGFANGRYSIDLGPSILCSLPNLISKPLVTTKYFANKLVGIPDILSQKNYHSAFFHGTQNNSMHFNSFAARVGFHDYYGADNYPYSGHHNGVWGIYDEEFLQFSLEKMDTFKEPFFSLIFTLSSHPPYIVPERYQGRFPKGTLGIHESIGYADYAVKTFFEKARTKPWFKDTLFIITADHAFKSDQAQFQDDLGRYRIPFIFYHPSVDLSGFDDQKIVQHVDLLPTIMDFLNITEYPQTAFGQSVFAQGSGEAFNYNGLSYWQLDGERFIKISSSGHLTSYAHKNTWTLKAEPATQENASSQKFRQTLKAYFHGLVHNSWYQQHRGPTLH